MYHILIIEDDFSLAEAMKKQIESWGNEVVCVQDFQNVLMAFTQCDPSGTGRYYAAVFQRISLVYRDPQNLTGSDCVYQLGF